MNNIHKQIKLAKKSLMKHKDNIPYVFPEWQYMLECKRVLKIAKKDYKEAKRNWDNLGR